MVEVLGVIDKDERHDLALIKLGSMGRPQLQICASNPPVGSRAYAVGAPKGFDFSITDGLISQIQTVDGFPQFQVSCPISGGNSGGPLVNERGEVAGIASWTKKGAQNLNFATPASFLAVIFVLRVDYLRCRFPPRWQRLFRWLPSAFHSSLSLAR
jgi:serine protease Do